MIRQHPILTTVIIGVILIIAWLIDELRWKMKPDEEFIAMTKSSDPRRILMGIKFLKKRGKDISGYIHTALPFLVSKSSLYRVAAKMTLQKYYPDDYALIKDYSGSENIEICRAKVAELYKKYQFNTTGKNHLNSENQENVQRYE